jgi:hypothetical protein
MTDYSTVAEFTAATVSLSDDTMVYIQNYYGVDGGGHWCRIKSSPPSPTFHYAWHKSANNKYAILAETRPTFKMFGGVSGPDLRNTTAFNTALSYAEATGNYYCFIDGSFTLIKRPWVIKTRMRWAGSVVLGSDIVANYPDDFAHGLFHQVCSLDAGGLSIDNLHILSFRTTFGGCAIISRCGRRTDITITGTPTIGEVVTINFHFSAADHNVSYTVLSGDTLEDICHGLDHAVMSAITVFNAGFAPAVYDNILIMTGNPQLTATISGGTTGTLVVTVGSSTDLTVGYQFLSNVEISSMNGWDYPIFLDASRQLVVGAPSVRTVAWNGVGCFGGQYAACRIDAESISWMGGYCVQAGGVTGNLQIGVTSPGVQDSNISIALITDNLVLDFVKRTMITVGSIYHNCTNTGNSEDVRVLSAKIGGTKQTNWTGTSGYV